MNISNQDAADHPVNAEVRGLEQAGLGELRAKWRSKWGAPPKLRSVHLLRMITAWRLQSDVYGGLDDDTRQRLRRTCGPRMPNPPVGTRLTREYQGVLYEVEIIDGGVRYAGREYGSLSEVARLITGVHWNGPRFFGLRQEARS